MLRLTKHEGWGNDFLVLADEDNSEPVTPELARRLCDRRFGIGADGLLHLRRPEMADLGMTLHNADGSYAEMSGNGLRCLIQAALRLGWFEGQDVSVFTGAGLRSGHVVDITDPFATTHQIRVDMGTVLIEGSDDDDMLVNVGNPHRVRRVPDPSTYDLAAAGAKYPDVNLEVIAAGAGSGTVKMRVHERGAGETLACGTGACAVAVAAAKWGLVTGTSVTVRQPGGDANVDITDTDHVQLAGPVSFIGSIEIPE
ncbi:MAG: diaminopimelate epimerase [Acidimicrobiales bacterium]|nr:diaminopimelate epimerase [Acidimicrobiales bacterium]